MPVYASARIRMTDRPGALSAIGAALAANGVDIVRLDVVSHEGTSVIDDLYLAAASQADIDRALGSFFTDVVVERLAGAGTDVVLDLGSALGRVASAPGMVEARQAALMGALVFIHAQAGALLELREDGAFETVAPPGQADPIPPGAGFAGRWVLRNRQAAAFPADSGWAPGPFREKLGHGMVAVAPCGAAGLLAVSREGAGFYSGELERLLVYADAAGAILALKAGAPAPTPDLPAGDELPEGALTVRREATAG